MEMDKFDVIAYTIESLSNRMKTLHSEYLSEELDGFLYDLRKPEWQMNCRMTRFANCFQLIDPLHSNGTCVQVYDDGDIYIGTFNQENERDGSGAYLYPNGDVYYGPWKNGHRSGRGYCEYRGGKHERVEAEADAPVVPRPVYRSKSFWQRLFSDKTLGRLDFLLANFLLAIPVAILVNLFPLIANSFIFLGAAIVWLMFYVKRCRDCGFNFFVGLLLFIFSPLTLLVFIWPGKYVSSQPVSSPRRTTASSSAGGTPASGPNLPLSANANKLSDQMRNQARTGLGDRGCNSSPQMQTRRSEDDSYAQNQADKDREQQERNERLRKQKEEDDRRKQSDEDLRQREINRIKLDYEDARRKYEMAKMDMERALTQAQTEKSYAEDEERRAREYDDESALGRAREYYDRYEMNMDEAEKAKQEAEEYERRLETCRNRLALLKEYI